MKKKDNLNNVNEIEFEQMPNMPEAEEPAKLQETEDPKVLRSVILCVVTITVLALTIGLVIFLFNKSAKKPADNVGNNEEVTQVTNEVEEQPTVDVTPSEEPEVVEPAPSEEPVVAPEITEEPVVENSREVLEFDYYACEDLSYLDMYSQDGIMIYAEIVDGDVCYLIPYYDGDTIEDNLEVSKYFLCYPLRPNEILFSNELLNQNYGTSLNHESFCDFNYIMKLQEDEEITVTVSYDDGRVYEMTFNYITIKD